MCRLSLMAFLLGLATVSQALGDIRRPPPKVKYVEPRVRFDGVEKHADLAFVLRFNSNTSGNAFSGPLSTFEVKDSEPFTLTGAGKYIAGVHLLAIDRKEFDKRKADDAKLTWLTDKTPGVLKADMADPPNTVPISAKQIPVTTYRVSLTDGKLKVAMVGAKVKTSQATPEGEGEGPLPAWVFGVVSALSFALFGVWFVRRRQVV